MVSPRYLLIRALRYLSRPTLQSAERLPLRPESRSRVIGQALSPRLILVIGSGRVRSRSPLYGDVILASLVVSVLGLVSAIYTMQVYDRVVPTGALSTYLFSRWGYLRRSFWRRSEAPQVSPRAAVSDRIDQHLSGLFFQQSRCRSGWMRGRVRSARCTQIRGHEVVRRYMTSSFLFPVRGYAVRAPFLGFLWVLGGVIVLVPLALIPVGILVGLGLRAPLERYTALAAEESNKRNGPLVEALDGIETVKAVDPSGI